MKPQWSKLLTFGRSFGRDVGNTIADSFLKIVIAENVNHWALVHPLSLRGMFQCNVVYTSSGVTERKLTFCGASEIRKWDTEVDGVLTYSPGAYK